MNVAETRGVLTVHDRMGCLLNERQAADLLNIRVPTLRRWRWAGKGPRFLKLGGAVRYEPSELEDFIASARRASTADPGTGLPGRNAAI
jgi:predicted DNA-binding transcriptional regulator AlpA